MCEAGPAMCGFGIGAICKRGPRELKTEAHAGTEQWPESCSHSGLSWNTENLKPESIP